MALTPADVHNVAFSRPRIGKRGYSEQEVDLFIDLVEQELMRVLPQERWIAFSHQVIHHGRQVCLARNPKCERCNLETLCRSKDKTWES